MIVMMMVGSLAFRGACARSCLRHLWPLRSLKTSGLRSLIELISKVVQDLGLGATGLAGGILETRGDLGCYRLELGGVLLRELLHLAEELPRS